MGRFNYRGLSEEERQKIVSELMAVMSSIRKKDDLQAFFLQLVTKSEAVMLARRWQIAKRLAAGKSYYAISEDLKVGMSTIQSVDQWLSDAIGDYRQRLEEVKAKKRRRIRLQRIDMPDSFYGIRHRYAGAFLLVNILLDGVDYLRQEELRKKVRGKTKEDE